MAAGDKNSIQKLQAGLKLLGYDVGNVDGALGKNTRTQIDKFLKDNKISDANPNDMAQILEKVRQKTLSDNGANERLMKMAQNPTALNSEDTKVLQGGLALHNVRTGDGSDRIVIDGKAGTQTTEASAKFTAAAPLNSTQIKLLQGGLALLGYETGAIDGKLTRRDGKESETQAAMKKFAADHGLENASSAKILEAVQKVVKGNSDAKELIHAVGNSKSAPTENVMMMQAGLSLLGHTTLIDGIMGRETTGNFEAWSGKSPRAIEQLPDNKTEITVDKHATASPRAEMSKAARELPAITEARNYTETEIKQRQLETLSSLKDASATAGVSMELMLRIRRQESHNGTDLVSGTECLGDWQFTKKTFNGCINNFGKEVISDLEKRGDFKHAQKIRDYMLSGGESEDLRLDPTISTWLAARLVKENQGYLKSHIENFDPSDKATWGTQYAAFNIGPSRAYKMSTTWAERENVGEMIGRDAEANKSYYRGGATGAEALKRYNLAVENGPRDVKLSIEEQMKTAMGDGNIRRVSYKTDTADKPFTSMNAFREATAHTVSDDSSTALTGIKEAKIELVRWAKPQQPAFSLQPNLTM